MKTSLRSVYLLFLFGGRVKIQNHRKIHLGRKMNGNFLSFVDTVHLVNVKENKEHIYNQTKLHN